MRTYYVLTIVCVLVLLPTVLRKVGRFENYDVCPRSTRFGHLYPAGTFVLKDHAKDELCRMMDTVHRICVALKIPYVVSSGSLLGHERHQKSIMPFDDDIDLYVFQSLPSTAFRELLPDNMSLVWNVGWWKVISKRFSLFDRLAIAIDLFEMKTTASNEITLKNDFARRCWPKEVFARQDLFPVRPSTLCGVPVFVPNRPTHILDQQYGTDWQKVAYVNNVHAPFPYLATHFSLVAGPHKISMDTTRCVGWPSIQPDDAGIQRPRKENPSQVQVKRPRQPATQE